MKRRTKIVVGVGAGVAVLLACGAALYWSSVPYQFLKGSQVQGIVLETKLSMMLQGSVGSPLVYRSYWLDRKFEDVSDDACKELSIDSSLGRFQFQVIDKVTVKTPGRRDTDLKMRPDGDGTIVTVITQSTSADRFEAWVWNLTHRKHDQ